MPINTRLQSRKWIYGPLLILLGLLGLWYAANAYLKAVMDVKAIREVKAVAVNKEYIRFNDKNRSYINEEGVLKETPVGFEEWRVYYKIVDFQGFDEKTQQRLLAREQKR